MVTSQESRNLKCERSKLLSEYLDFLGNHRGLKKKTICMRGHDVTAFLKSLKLQNDQEDIGTMSVSQVYDYVIKTAKPMKRPTRKRTSGVFFRTLTPASLFAHPLPVHLLTEQFPASPCHRMLVKSEELCYLAIAAVAQFLCLQACIETPLLLIKQTVK
jgi:hypothetical protein